jgi:hypothetical protein
MFGVVNETAPVGPSWGSNQAVLRCPRCAYNLARRFVHETHDTGASFTRAWVLKIVPNTSYTFLEKNRFADATI